jgi:hypothetical protein
MQESLKEGKYYLGDPCFALSEYYHYDVWQDKYKCESGKIDLTDKEEDFMIVHNTHYGDGIYHDSKKRRYNVETGTISLIPFEFIEDIELAKKNGKIFEFIDEALFIYDAGHFVIRSGHFVIKINTINEEMYNSDDEEHLLEDGEKVSYFTTHDNSDFEDLYSSDEEEKQNIKEKKKTKQFFKSK